MKNLFKWLWFIGMTLALSGCLEVTPKTKTLLLADGETQIFTAKSNLTNVDVVWRLDGEEVATGNDYSFMAVGDCSVEKSHQLSATEIGGATPMFNQTVTWTIGIPRVECPLCYLDEDGDGFGDIEKPVNTTEPPENCIADSTDCDDSNPTIHPNAPEKMDGIDNNCNGKVDENILLYVYSKTSYQLLETLEMEEEGPITITVQDETQTYIVYIKRSGYFTEYVSCNYGDTITVDLEPIDPEKFNGVITLNDGNSGPIYLSDTVITVYKHNQSVMNFKTDDMGRFSIEIEPGYYTATLSDMGISDYKEDFTVEGSYADFQITTYIQVLKPNIYIYPDETINLSVDVLFPQGGYVSESIPDYGSGWHVTVAPSGLIDDQYTYLFYESVQPDLCQYARGWVVETVALTEFFKENMARTGFNEREIADFIEYWIPRLTDHPFYAIYPQYKEDLDPMMRLQFSVQPDNLIRLIYSVKGLEKKSVTLSEPEIPDFSREGFEAAEWGVIIK